MLGDALVFVSQFLGKILKCQKTGEACLKDGTQSVNRCLVFLYGRQESEENINKKSHGLDLEKETNRGATTYKSDRKELFQSFFSYSHQCNCFEQMFSTSENSTFN